MSSSFPWIHRLIFCVCFFYMAGCGSADTAGPIRVDIGKSNPDRLLKFYFGSYAKGTPADPFLTGLLAKSEGVYTLDRSRLPEEVRPLLADADGNDVLDWDELEPFLQQTYYTVRPAPPTIDALRAATPYGDAAEWMLVEIDGVMTTARRKVYIHRNAIRAALEGYEANDARLMYPVGTVIVGEHWDAEELVEATMMKKRADGFWDYAVYDAAGSLAAKTSTPPRTLTVPTRCVGCHFGEKKFEPENSYPSPAPPGPGGPREIHGRAPATDAGIVEVLDEHVKRSDTILGLYVTLYLSDLKRRLDAGEAPEGTDAELLAWARAQGMFQTPAD